MRVPNRNYWLAKLGQAFIGAIFLVTGISKIADRSGTLAYMTAHGVPAASFFRALAITLELGGGLALLFLPRPRLAAMLLILFLLPTTLLFPGFWTLEGLERQRQMIQFLKNLAIAGGLLQIVAFSARPQ